MAVPSAPDYIGYYYWTWSKNPPAPPEGVNLGVAFSGWTDIANALGQSNKIQAGLTGQKTIGLGGGNENGSWNADALTAVEAAIKGGKFAAYAGITFDIELGDNGLADHFASVFRSARDQRILVVVTVSHSAPFGFLDGAALMQAFFQDPNIDVLSPQLYTTGQETRNDFATSHGVQWSAYANARAAIVPSIVKADMFDDARNFFAENRVLLNGFIKWSQT